jgi:hypothetical protein
MHVALLPFPPSFLLHPLFSCRHHADSAPNDNCGLNSGLALETCGPGEYCIPRGQLKRSKKVVAIHGLNKNQNHDLKNVFKGARFGPLSSLDPPQEFTWRV